MLNYRGIPSLIFYFMLVSNQSSPSVPLCQVLFHASNAVKQVLAGQSLTEFLESVPKEQKSAVQSISFYCMRHLLSSQKLSQQLLTKKAPNSLVYALLLVSLCLLSVPKRHAKALELDQLDESVPFYQAFTVVDETVKATQLHKKSAAFKGLINACLRRYIREEEVLWSLLKDDEECQFNYPKWWIQLIKKSYPTQWENVLNAANLPGPLTLRVNRKKIRREEFCQTLTESGIDYQLYGEDAVILNKAMPVQAIPGFEQGLCAVQDAGAQLAGTLLPVKDGMQVLDACAAPGGKTAHLLERADIYMTAVDIDQKRLSRVEQNLKHLGHYSDKVKLLSEDVSDVSAWWDGKLFDMIMADVPCTASGIVRRHPDIKWLRQESDIQKTADLQRKIVKNLWQTLKPGGYFLYITCSVFPQEGEQQAQFIEQTFADACRLEAPGQLLPLATVDNPRPLQDGFFYALFQKK
ncbi:16S rRNA (cytosine(967)-C(5))-methyltransferase RsmB [Pelistega indica]|nr:16S rRNA (cytosine(967)-C(5))-methyltransferase RsmB [Pelistega indica]